MSSTQQTLSFLGFRTYVYVSRKAIAAMNMSWLNFTFWTRVHRLSWALRRLVTRLDTWASVPALSFNTEHSWHNRPRQLGLGTWAGIGVGKS